MVILAFFGAMGPTCDGQPIATVLLDPPELDLVVGESATIRIEISTESPVQALEMAVAADPAIATLISVVPDAEFNQTGAFLVQPEVDTEQGEIRRAVDLRRGDTAIAGSFFFATVTVSAAAPGETILQPIGTGIAGPNGEPIVAELSNATTIRVSGP